jgi:hypothetical protein
MEDHRAGSETGQTFGIARTTAQSWRSRFVEWPNNREPRETCEMMPGP